MGKEKLRKWKIDQQISKQIKSQPLPNDDDATEDVVYEMLRLSP